MIDLKGSKNFVICHLFVNMINFHRYIFTFQPYNAHLESFTGEVKTGTVFGALPVYRVSLQI